MPLIFLLVLLTILTKVPFVLLLVGLWFVFGWRHHARRHWSHRRGTAQMSGSRFAIRGSCS